jgi:hypothetical protein
LAVSLVERKYKRPDRGIPDSWRRDATVNPPQSVHVSSTNTSAKAAKSKKNQQRNPPTAPVAGADSNG